MDVETPLGPARVLGTLHAFQREHGDDFRPAALLERLAGEGGRFQDL